MSPGDMQSSSRGNPPETYSGPSRPDLPAHFRIERELGRGGMATVYLCTDSRNERLVAAKVLHSDYASALATERFFREVEFISRLDHPCIPKVIETGITGELPFYVMTYVEGEPLRKLLERQRQISVAETVRIARAALGPMGYAHDRGIVHRDIKPDNLIVAADGVHVLDFGIARAIVDAGGERLTKTGLTVGTPAYLSPEQALADRTLDQRSDIFSLGCVIYEMLAGAPAFSGPTPQALIARRFAAPPRPLSELRSDVPDALARVVTRAMAVPQGDRYATAAELDAALEASIRTEAPEVPGADLLARLKMIFADSYRVEEEMKGGGMSRLFLATDLELRRKVVIKILPPDLTSPMMLSRFRRESEVTARLQHPHILPVISAGVRDGLAFYMMPFFEGESLRARMKREGRLPIADAERILTEMTDALSCAHEQGVIHRDIKPENILILGGHAVLADFGIASALSNAGGGERITGTGISLGTVGYMAPEQALGEKNVDGRADIYSLAVIGYEMLAGVPPFTGDTDQAILVGHLTREAQPVESLRQDAPPALTAAITRGLEKDPAHRFQSAKDFREALKDAGISTSSPSRPRSEPVITAPIASKPRRGMSWQIAVPVALAVLVASGAAYVKMRPAPTVVSSLNARSIAVLYFKDLSPQKDLGHLADAFTEDLIAKLQEVNTLDVVSKNGVQQIRDAKIEPDSAARLFKAGTLVEGSVEPVNDKLRVAVALFDGASGTEVQRASFEYPAADPLGLRAQIAKDVSEFLRKRLGEEVRLTELKSGTTDANAWVLLQRGDRHIKESETLAASGDTLGAARSLGLADSLFALSAARDTKWAEPVTMRGTVALRRSRTASLATDMGKWANAGLEFAGRGITLEPRSATGLELRGTLRYWKWINDLAVDPKEAAELLRLAEVDLREAVKISPHRGSAWSVLSSLYSNKDDPIEAAMAARRAYEEDAYLSAAPDIIWRLYSSAYDNLQSVQAEHWCSEGRTRFPSNPRFVQCRLWLLTMPGMRMRPDSAWRLIADLRKITPDKDWVFEGREAPMLVAAGLVHAGMPDSARRVLVRSRGDATTDPSRDLLIDEAVIRVILGDKDEALKLLKQYLVANPEHRAGMAETQSWWWRDLKNDPRYKEMVGSAN